MPLTKQFLSFWKNNYNMLSLSLYSLIMFAFEKVVEIEFKCPKKKSLQIVYVFSYFFCPAFIIFFLSAITNAACIPCARRVRKFFCWQRSEVFFKALLPSLIWCVILLCDGRYINCVVSGDESQNAIQSKTEATALPSEVFIWSQVSGLFLLAVVVCLYGMCYVWPLWFCCGYEEEKHQGAESGILLEDKHRTQREERKEEDA